MKGFIIIIIIIIIICLFKSSDLTLPDTQNTNRGEKKNNKKYITAVVVWQEIM